MTQIVSLPQTTTQIPALLTLKEVMSHLRVSRSTVYRLINNKKLPVYHAGVQLRFYPQDVVAVLQRVA